MANSKTGGAFGFLRKSIGSVTYSTQKDTNGKRIQIVRSKPTDVANPNTVGQILQRMKIKPAARFYAAFEEVLNNAFEGVNYGNDSRKEFMRLAMSVTGPYIPKGATRFIPAKYPVSRGTVPTQGSLWYGAMDSNMSAVNGTKGFVYDVNNAGADSGDRFQEMMETLYGREVQFTFIAVTQNENGDFVYGYERVLSGGVSVATGSPYILAVGNDASVVIEDVDNQNYIQFYKGEYDSEWEVSEKKAAFAGVVAAAVIVSYKEGENWLRSESDMVISDALEVNLYGSEAQQLAVESYKSGASVNNLNSEWYLNLANGQQYPGTLTLVSETIDYTYYVSEEPHEVFIPVTYPYGSLINELGGLTHQVFADSGGNMIFNVNGAYTTVQKPGAAEGVWLKWDDIKMDSRYYGAKVATWKDAYQLQIEA